MLSVFCSPSRYTQGRGATPHRDDDSVVPNVRTVVSGALVANRSGSVSPPIELLRSGASRLSLGHRPIRDGVQPRCRVATRSSSTYHQRESAGVFGLPNESPCRRDTANEASPMPYDLFVSYCRRGNGQGDGRISQFVDRPPPRFRHPRRPAARALLRQGRYPRHGRLA